MDGNQSASGQAANRLCAEQYPDAASRSEGNTINHNRQSSLLEVCDGFGAPEGLVLSPSMKCALVAASATFAGAGAAATAIENGPCLGADIADAYGKKDWLGPAKGAACNYFGEVFAGGVGVVAAGAASGTGPGAAAVGVITYRALAGGLKIACGGLLDGGARDLGAKLEANYEMHVATDIVHRGKCLRYDNSAKIKKWTAVRCAS
jgi:hypothetical protein